MVRLTTRKLRRAHRRAAAMRLAAQLELCETKAESILARRFDSTEVGVSLHPATVRDVHLRHGGPAAEVRGRALIAGTAVQLVAYYAHRTHTWAVEVTRDGRRVTDRNALYPAT